LEFNPESSRYRLRKCRSHRDRLVTFPITELDGTAVGETADAGRVSLLSAHEEMNRHASGHVILQKTPLIRVSALTILALPLEEAWGEELVLVLKLMAVTALVKSHEQEHVLSANDEPRVPYRLRKRLAK
jgi:hypothetical protein